MWEGIPTKNVQDCVTYEMCHTFKVTTCYTLLNTNYRGGSRGGPGGQDPPPPPPFRGTPKLHKEGKKTLRVHARKCRVLVLNSYPDPPPPFRNPGSAPELANAVNEFDNGYSTLYYGVMQSTSSCKHFYEDRI